MSKFKKQAETIVNQLIESEIDLDIEDAGVTGVEGEDEEIREVVIGTEIKDLVERFKNEDEESVLDQIIELANELIELHTPEEEAKGEEEAKKEEIEGEVAEEPKE